MASSMSVLASSMQAFSIWVQYLICLFSEMRLEHMSNFYVNTAHVDYNYNLLGK